MAAILCFFLGIFGVHRFYAGRTTSAKVMLLLSLTVFGLALTVLWALIDFIRILRGGFKDGYGRKIK
jgi:TM2 domain-containing membrane protein YozV